MKTTTYHPSQLEVDFANAIHMMQKELEKHLQNNKIVDIKSELGAENPLVRFHLEDTDGDRHEVVIKIIQIPDKS